MGPCRQCPVVCVKASVRPGLTPQIAPNRRHRSRTTVANDRVVAKPVAHDDRRGGPERSWGPLCGRAETSSLQEHVGRRAHRWSVEPGIRSAMRRPPRHKHPIRARESPVTERSLQPSTAEALRPRRVRMPVRSSRYVVPARALRSGNAAARPCSNSSSRNRDVIGRGVHLARDRHQLGAVHRLDGARPRWPPSTKGSSASWICASALEAHRATNP
jgi:hypothetical protein